MTNLPPSATTDTADGEVVATVTALATTPVKGLRMRSRESLWLAEQGAAENRRFYLIDERGRMINGKRLGALSSVIADYDVDRDLLRLTFPDGAVIGGTVNTIGSVATRFFSRELTADLVDGPWAEALSAYTRAALRLVRAPANSAAVDRGASGAVSLVSSASVEHLRQVAGEIVDARRFRMLVEVTGVAAYAEDEWVGRRMWLGDALVAFRGHVGRCLVTSQNPETGVVDLQTLELLRSYREGLATSEPLSFGVYGEVLGAGAVRRGDKVRFASVQA